MNSQETVLAVILVLVLVYLWGCRRIDKKHDKRIDQYKKDTGCYLL